VTNLKVALRWMTAFAIFHPLSLHAQKQYPLCYVAGGFVVGEVPDQPFTAHLVHGTSKLSPDGSQTNFEPADTTFAIVARDSSGRVLTRKPSPLGASASRSAEQGWWTETLCDPKAAAAGAVIYMNFRDSSGRIQPSRNSNIMETPADAEGGGIVKPRSPHEHTTITFQYWHRHVEGRTNLPEESFEGLAAYRYRLTRTREPNSIHDVVNSDDLFTQLAQTTWVKYPDSENETRLTEIQLGEPRATLFDVPHGVRLINGQMDDVSRRVDGKLDFTEPHSFASCVPPERTSSIVSR
jgi:hypothetical protein